MHSPYEATGLVRSAKEARQAWIRALEAVGVMQREPGLTLPGMLAGLAQLHGRRVALFGAEESLTFAELAERVERIACWAAGRCAGQTVGVLMPNRPELVAVWLGLTRVGCVAALLNPNLRGEGLAHSVGAGGCTLVIADDGLADRVSGVPVLAHSVFERELGSTGALPPMPAQETTALLVFTSGTTGLPKAARVSHGRVLEWALWFGGMMDLGPDDRIYDCLPLYHSTGGIVAIGAALVRGASVLIAPGFRASRFWDEVIGGECTVFFYIGELCRYLVQSPAHSGERAHRLRLACGNGLHGSVWEAFQARFGVPEILEFYAATEGTVSLYNCEGKPGAIGRVPPFLRERFPMALIRLDEDGVPVRDAAGRCVRADMDEAGEAIGRVERAGAAARRFDGYTDAEASAGKLVHDVFAAGDCWFRSGDLMRQDSAGFISFVDRLGDTFRWKGENVSTSEVAAVMRRCPGVAVAVVYGVRVPGQEGRAGMAAVVAGPGFDLGGLWAHGVAELPGYARPVFVRLCGEIAVTGTFKLGAAALAQEGYAGGEVWVADRGRGGYAPLDVGAIERGELRL